MLSWNLSTVNQAMYYLLPLRYTTLLGKKNININITSNDRITQRNLSIDSENAGDLPFAEGDRINVLNNDDAEGWWQGELNGTMCCARFARCRRRFVVTFVLVCLFSFRPNWLVRKVCLILNALLFFFLSLSHGEDCFASNFVQRES